MRGDEREREGGNKEARNLMSATAAGSPHAVFWRTAADKIDGFPDRMR